MVDPTDERESAGDRETEPRFAAKYELALVFALALAARGLHLVQASASPLFRGLVSDAHTFDEWARTIAGGDWVGHEVFYQAPLYPYFLGSLYATVGRDLVLVRVVQACFGALACVLLAQAAGRLFGRGALRIAGVMLALYPPAIFFDGLIQKSALDGVLGAALIAALVHFLVSDPRRRTFTGAIIGVLLGLFALTRENTMIFVPLIAAWMIVISTGETRRVRWIAPAVMCAMFLVTLAPVAARNHAVGGGFAPTTWNAGANFYIGNSQTSNGTYVPLRIGRADPAYERHDALDLAAQALGHPVTPGEASGYWFGEAWRFIRDDTGGWLRLVAWKIGLASNVHEIGDAEDLYFTERTCWFVRGLDTFWNFGVLLPLAAAGIVATWSKRRELWIFHALLGAVFVGLVAFFVFGRFRYPAVPYLVLFAAGGIVEIARRVRLRRWPALVVPCAVLLGAAVVSNLPLVARDQLAYAGYLNTAKAAAQLGRDVEAMAAFRQALELEPQSVEAHLGIAKQLLGAGRNEESLAELRESHRLVPTDPDVLVELGKGFVLVGDLDGARKSYEEALRAWPDHPAALSALGALEVLTDMAATGLEKMRAAVKAAPDDSNLAREFAFMLLLCPDPMLRDPREAVRVAEQAVSRATFDRPYALQVLSEAHAACGDNARALDAAERGLADARERGIASLVSIFEQSCSELRAATSRPREAR